MKLIVEPNRNLHPIIYKVIAGVVVVVNFDAACELLASKPEQVITHLEMKRGDGSPDSQPYGLALAAQCQKLNIPFIIVTSRPEVSCAAIMEMTAVLGWEIRTNWSGSEKDWQGIASGAEYVPKRIPIQTAPPAEVPVPIA